MSANAVAALLNGAWVSRRSEFESSCRSGSGADPDEIAAQFAREFEAAARQELLAIRDTCGRSSATPANDTRPSRMGETAPSIDRTREVDPLGTLTFDHEGTADLTTRPLGEGHVPPVAKKPPVVPGYAITGVLGHGGMGIVYRATHLALNREVALKMILKGEHASPGSVARFLGEARAVAKLNHPNIVQIYQIDDSDGLPSFALEYCSRGSLSKELNKEPQPPRKAAAAVETLCRAIQAAHDAGVIHRDIKPANVLVAADGVLKVTDFGIARIADGLDQTGTGSILGSPPYMSPEQASGRIHDVGPLSDQYSLGATLYEYLTGNPPFRGPTAIETIKQVIEREPVPPSALQPGVPKDLETICLKALAKNPAKRYPSASAMADDLKAFLEGRPIMARPVGRAEKLWRWAKRNPRVAALLAAVAVLLAALAFGGAVFSAVYRAKATEAENNFHKAEDRGGKLAVALGESEKNLKESNENYTFARDISVAISQKLPAVLQSRVADSGARSDISDLIAEAMLNRKGGVVRQLPDRVLFTVLLQKTDSALDRRNFKKAQDELTTATALAERMRATEPVEFDKADSHYARALQKRAYLHYRVGQLSKSSTEEKAEWALGRGDIDRAVEISRQRVISPRSGEIEPSEREMNLAEFVALQSRFEDEPARAEAMLKEAIEMAAAIVRAKKGDMGALRFLAGLHYQYSEWLNDQRRRPERKAALVKAVAEMTAYQAANSDDVSVRMTLGEWNRELGDMIMLDGDRVGPLGYYRTAYDLLRPLARTPQVLSMQKDFAADAYRAGLAALEAKDSEEAERHFRSSFRVAEETIDRGKVTTELLNLAALAAARCGEYRRAKYWIGKVEAQAKRDSKQLMEAACCTATLAGSIDATPDTAHLTPEKRAELKEKTVAAAIKLLKEWRDVLNSPANEKNLAKNIASFVRRLNTEPDLDALRSEATFKTFVKETTELR